MTSSSTPPSVPVRPARPEDGDQLLDLVRALLADQGDDPAGFDPERFLDDAFGDDPPFQVLVADAGGELAGYALFHDAYEPAYAARGVYLCDLYVHAAQRRRGVARALLAAVAAEARSRRRTFVWWISQAGRDVAEAFYETVTDVHVPVTAHALTFGRFEELADGAD